MPASIMTYSRTQMYYDDITDVVLLLHSKQADLWWLGISSYSVKWPIQKWVGWMSYKVGNTHCLWKIKQNGLQMIAVKVADCWIWYRLFDIIILSSWFMLGLL